MIVYPGGISNIDAGGCTPLQLHMHRRSPKVPIVRVKMGIFNRVLVHISQLVRNPPGAKR